MARIARQVASNRITNLLLGALLLALIISPAVRSEANLPADKVGAAGSSTEIVGPGENVVLLSKQFRASNTSDWILAVTAECSIITNLKTVDTDEASAFGEVKVWVEIDGIPVPVSTADPDAGRVVFCNRAYRSKVTFVDGDNDDQLTIETFMETRSANGFNWMKINVGRGIHTVQVKATLTESVNDPAKAYAKAVVGNRTLIMEPTKLPPGATLDSN